MFVNFKLEEDCGELELSAPYPPGEGRKKYLEIVH